jgi:hypothetical protein
MVYKSKHDTKIEDALIESLVGQKHIHQIKSGNTGALKGAKDRRTKARGALAGERMVKALNPNAVEGSKFHEKRNMMRRRKRAQQKKGMSDTMREIIDKVASPVDLISQFRKK